MQETNYFINPLASVLIPKKTNNKNEALAFLFLVYKQARVVSSAYSYF